MLSAFPQFGHISLDDKEEYEKLIEKYPPYSDILFPTLQIWWNLDNKLAASLLNSNLVINYHLPFDDQNSGYCLVGTENIDNSIEKIFGHLKQHNKLPKLVHVPEFTVEKIKNKALLEIEEERDYHEYIVQSSSLAKLEGSGFAKARRSIRLFLRETTGKNIEIKSLDLSSEESEKKLILSLENLVKKHPAKNDLEHTEHRAIRKALSNHSILGIKNLCLYIDGEIEGFVLFHQPPGHKFFVVHHLKVNYDFPYIFDYLEHELAQNAVKHKIPYINCEMDLGIDGLRNHKTHLMPIDFFRKYIITPKE